MRRRIGTCLLAVLMLAALTVPAFAAGLQKPVEVDASKCTAELSGTDKVKVTVKSAVTGAQYLVFMLNGEGKPAEANIQYIDQNGTGAFVVFPKEGMKTGTYYIYVASNTDTRFDGTKYIATVEYQSDSAAYGLGDVNADGKTNTRDAALALKIYSKLIQSEEDATAQKIKATGWAERADVNGNGKVDTNDAARILQIYSGLRDPITGEKV